ncbi:MAG: hypothetical protein ACTSYB_15005 [Candidatus Helarchaeota archaeon]
MEISDEELAKLEKTIIEGLPLLLEKKPEIEVIINRILAKNFPTRTELTELINEMRTQRIQLEQNQKKQAQFLTTHGEELKEHGKELKSIREELKEHGKELKEHGKELKSIREELKEHNHILIRLDKGIGTIGRKIGADLEKLTKNIYLETLKKQGIDIKQIKRRKKFKVNGEEFEIDIYIENETVLLFETKYSATIHDAKEFLHKIKLIQTAYPSKKIQAFLIAINTLDDIDEFCEKNSIYLITSE